MRGVLFTVLAAIMLAACSGAPQAAQDGTGDTPTAEPTAAEPTAAEAVTQDAAPEAAPQPADLGPFDFTVPALGGGQIDGADLVGRDLALWFWAPWCPNCNHEAPAVAEVARDYRDRVTVVGVAGRDTTEAMAAFVSEHGLAAMPTASDVDGVVWERFQILGQPAMVFIDGQTGRTEVIYGAMGEDVMRERLDALLG